MCARNATPSTQDSRKFWILRDVLTNSAVNTGCSKPGHHPVHHPATLFRCNRTTVAVIFLCLVSSLLQADDQLFSDNSCNTGTYHERAVVKQIIDGDTIILADDRHIRLIGINTPEINHETGDSQPGAEIARDYLVHLLEPGTAIYLVYDEQRRDRYQRTLAHLFLINGVNIQSQILGRGLATSLTIPPNTAFLDCYIKSMQHARSTATGLWAMKQYQPVSAANLAGTVAGYRLITGRVTRVSQAATATWIVLDDRVSLRITRKDMDYFDESTLTDLAGNQLLVQGWLYFHNDEPRMRIRHPADMFMPGNRN